MYREEISRLHPNSYQDTIAYRLCSLMSGFGALYIIGLTYYVRNYSGVHGVPTIFTPLWAGIFLIVSSLVTCLIHNNRSKLRLSLVLVILCITLFTCSLGAFTSGIGAEYFRTNTCRVYVEKKLCVCGEHADNLVTVNTPFIHDCKRHVNTLRGLMLVTCLICIMTLTFLMLQVLVVIVQIKSSMSLAEISNALVRGAGDEITDKYSHGETGGTVAEMTEQSTKLIVPPRAAM